ncbi:FecR family protein [Maribacter flavus]|uniref:DUF4974 domain-containing protein n=1 Tax=Maribacter flavus TaxID=1658664 RepID=A0A5B2TZD4_9FLAO|nr:FecR domain-containing protein [Maribacter flavus]KAA2219886.1 DUF4974 domain-containing protein [Maribacter flavus]
MKSNKSKILTNEERRALRRQIMNSATAFEKENRRKKYYVVFAAAASLALLMGLFFYSYDDQKQGLQEFVNKTPRVDPKTQSEVTVVLGDGENIPIDSNNTVQYSPNGANVILGKGKTFNQETLIDKKPIYNTIIVPYGKKSDVLLSDGTRVWINSGSKLIYPAVFNRENREVYLEGEAIFDVAHNAEKPFKVLSKNQEIEVLGTIFNVSAYLEDEQLNTVLKSGSVKITYLEDESKSFKITPGTLASLNVKSLIVERRKVDVDDYFGWRDGYLSLKRQPLDYIVAKLSRYYNIEILIFDEELSKETFSGKLDLKDDINKVINILNEATKMRVIKDNGKIILTN